MKSIKYLAVMLLAGVNCFGGDLHQISIPSEKVDVKIYSQLQTNWGFYTNSFEVECGWGTNTEKQMIMEKQASAYIGTVVSNNICDLTYDGQIKNSTVLNSKEIGKIEITWKDKTIFNTNYFNE
jgi:hypothetical protein